jgi:WD40 repeat protein
MTPNKKLEQAMQLLGWGIKDTAERIGTDVKTLEGWIRGETFPDPHYCQGLCKLFGKGADELGLVKDNIDVPQSDNVTPVSLSAPSPLAISSPPNAQLGVRGVLKRAHKSWPVVLIIVCIVVALLFAIGVGGALVIPGPQTRPASGTLIFFYHTPSQGIYVTYVNGVAWSPNSKYIACAAGDGTVRVLDITTKKEVFVYHGHHGWVNNAVWLPDSKHIASVSVDHTIQVWDALTGQRVFAFAGSSSLWAVAISPDSDYIAWSGKDGVVQVWRLSSKTHVYTYTGQVHSGGIWGLAFSPDGKRIASGDSAGGVQVWNALDGGSILIYGGHAGPIYDLKWSPNGKYIASASGDGTVQVWGASSGSIVYIHRFRSESMQAVSWAPNGARIASASTNGTVQLWDALNGGHPFIYPHHSGTVFTAAWSPNGSWIASGDESGALEVWLAG